MNIKVKLLILGILVLCGCYNRKADDMYPKPGCDTSAVSFAKDVQPVLIAHCTNGNCHGRNEAAYGLDVTSHDAIMSWGLLDRLVSSIKHEQGISPMPKGQLKLDECSINKITSRKKFAWF